MGSLDPRRGPRVFLGETLDADKVAADYAPGALTLTVLVHEAAKSRSIQVTSSDRAGRHRITFPGAGQSVPTLDDPYRPPPTQPPGPATPTDALQPSTRAARLRLASRLGANQVGVRVATPTAVAATATADLGPARPAVAPSVPAQPSQAELNWCRKRRAAGTRCARLRPQQGARRRPPGGWALINRVRRCGRR